LLLLLLLLLGDYLAELKANPSNTTPRIIDPTTKEVKLFNSHEDVDEYADKLRYKPDLYNEVMPLLKAFDRAFWLKEKKQNLAPRPGCPFQVITTTAAKHGSMSMIVQEDPGKARVQVNVNLLAQQQQQNQSSMTSGISAASDPARVDAAAIKHFNGAELPLTVDELQNRLDTPVELEDEDDQDESLVQRFSVGSVSGMSAIGPTAHGAAQPPPPDQGE